MGKERQSSHKPVDKHADFLRVSTPRVNKALKAIELLGNQAGAAYAPTRAEVAEMFKAIRTKVNETEQRFLGGGKQASGFSFNKKG